MIIQGAEAEVKINEEVTKKRSSKKYRHPRLDKRLREERTDTEARLLKDADRSGVNVPKVLEETEDTLKLQKIEGPILKEAITEKPDLAQALGRNVAKLHASDIIHGDLTTSNSIMGEDLYLIDFGLAFRSQRTEDKAVDIHLFKQVLNSSHPQIAETAWNKFIEGYKEYEKNKAVMERLEEVEKRGRYK